MLLTPPAWHGRKDRPMQLHGTTPLPHGYRSQLTGMTNPYRIEGDTTRVIVRRRDGREFHMLIDTSDLPTILALPGRIYASIQRSKTTELVYPVTTIGRRTVRIHRLLLGAAKHEEVDHRNHDGMDARRRNIRIATRAENMRNRRMGSWEAQKLVLQHKTRGRYGAWVYLGEFDTEEQAIEVYDEAYRALEAEDVWEYIERETVASQERTIKEDRSKYAA